ncbi:MAG: DedA family protein [Gulosibacter sp.]|uniref:DedA family protein n=1 Tax=Gulosibacter sp. TaxID=2817531 RepID=UPI003F909151
MVNNLLDWVIDAVQQLDPILLILVAGLGIMLETSVLIGLVVPGDTILLVASIGVTNWGLWAALVAAAIIGALLGETIGYWLGHWLGHPIKRSKLGRKVGEENWHKAETFLSRRGGLAVFISRFLPVLHSLVPLTAGIAGMPYRKFMAWTIPACTIWSLAYVSVGALATASYEQLSSQLSWAGYIFVAIIVLFFVIMWLAKRWLNRRFAKDFE